MKRSRLNMSQLHSWPELAIFAITVVLLLGSACTPPVESTPSPPEPANQPPTINSITAPKEVNSLTECQISCEANDADGDTLNYTWSADRATIEGEGNSIIWVAPDTGGDYTIGVTISDGKGGEAADSVTITVISGPNHPPVITGLTIDGNPPNEENQHLRTLRTVTIECIAEDPDGDELSYFWPRPTGGKIQGEGAKVGWTAPGVPGDYTVTVIVSDGRGDEAEASMQFDVLCCGR